MVGLKKFLGGMLVLSLTGSSFADIVYRGERVLAWPENAVVKFDNARGSGVKFAPSKTASHYSAPKGKVYGLTLLVDFSDQPAPVTVEEISDWLNKEGFNRDGCNGSVRDYYLDVSNGQLDFTNEVFGWYRAKHPKSYYEGLDGYSGSDELMKEVFAYFDSQVDFSRYDNDKNGVTEAINIVYAGAGQTWGQGLWPHSGWSDEKRDGVRLQTHQMTDMPGKFSIYVFVHECGHMIFGWPDLYWYGDYCTMGNRPNDKNPVAINDFFRADQGWIPFVDVSAGDVGKVSAGAGEQCFRFKNPGRPDKEGLVWSYVKNSGRNSVLAGSGILMQHYDFSIQGNSSADKLGLRIVHADSKGKNSDPENDQWPAPGSRASAFFNAGAYDAFSDALYPAIRWYSGDATGLNFTNVAVNGTRLEFCLGGDCSVSAGLDDGSSETPDEPLAVTEIPVAVKLPVSDSYAPVTVDLQAEKTAAALGIKVSEIASKSEFFAVEPDGSLNSEMTGEGTGHWFGANGAVAQWNPDGASVVFSNVDLTSMTAKVGHMPNKVKAGDSFTFRQALVRGSKQAMFVVSVTITDASGNVPDSGITAVSRLLRDGRVPSGLEVRYFDMNGNLLGSAPTRAGCYLVNVSSDGKTVRRFIVRSK